MSKKMINKHLSVPYNGDIDCLNGLFWEGVYEVYGAPTDTSIGNGRSRKNMSGITRENIFEAINICEKNNTYFNILFNAPYYSSGFFDNADYCISEYVDSLSDFQKIRYTVALPQVYDLIKKYSPTAEITVSRFAQIDSVSKLARWKDKGAYSVIISPDIIKSVDLIEKMCTLGIKVGVLVNDACLLGCPISVYHSINSSNHSTDETSNGYSDYCVKYCKGAFEENVYDILRSTYVRPEDLCYYKGLGVSYFKLVDRNMPTSWIWRAFRAYLELSYNGNLLDLFPLFFNSMNRYPMIDNKKLSNILELQKNHCTDEVCQVTCRNCNVLVDNT
jgi:collagenase-like PrtC family protease